MLRTSEVQSHVTAGLCSSDVDVNVGCLLAGVCYTVPLVGGRIADMVAGRFNTIFASFLILLVGR